jgi:hypothetical protein
MSSDHGETDTTKDNTVYTSVVQEDSSIGQKVGQGISCVSFPCTRVGVCMLTPYIHISGAMKVIHGTSPRKFGVVHFLFVEFDLCAC